MTHSGEIKDDLKKVLEWWTHCHMGRTFLFLTLTITQQCDRYLCGLLAWNGLTHCVYLLRYPLVNVSSVDDEWLKILLKIASCHQDRVSAVKYMFLVCTYFLNSDRVSTQLLKDISLRSPRPLWDYF